MVNSAFSATWAVLLLGLRNLGACHSVPLKRKEEKNLLSVQWTMAEPVLLDGKVDHGLPMKTSEDLTNASQSGKVSPTTSQN